MFSGAADAGAGKECSELADGKRAVARAVAQRHGFLRGILHHVQADKIIQLIHVGRIGLQIARAASLENHYGKRCALAKLLGHPDLSIRLQAARTLKEMGPVAQAAVPA